MWLPILHLQMNEQGIEAGHMQGLLHTSYFCSLLGFPVVCCLVLVSLRLFWFVSFVLFLRKGLIVLFI